MKQRVESLPVGFCELPAERLHHRDDRFRILLEHRELGVIATDLAPKSGNVGQAGVVAMRVEDDDRVVFGRKFLDDAAGGPTLAGSGHGEDCKVAADDGVTIDLDIDIGPVREPGDVEGTPLLLIQVTQHDPPDIGGLGSIRRGGRSCRIADLVQLAAAAPPYRLGAQDMTDGGHHLAAERKHGVEGVGLGGCQFVSSLDRKERVDTLDPGHLRPNPQFLRRAVIVVKADGSVDRNQVLFPDRLMIDRQPEFTAGALANERANESRRLNRHDHADYLSTPGRNNQSRCCA